MIAFLKICGLLIAVIIASAKKVPISITLIVAAVAAGFLFMPLEKIPLTFLKIIFSWDTWKYVLALWAVLLLEGSLNKMGMLKSLASSSVKMFTDRRYACAVLPSVIGFMPSVGGAYFSAPLVHEIAKDMDISKEKKAFINYWFRHNGSLFRLIRHFMASRNHRFRSQRSWHQFSHFLGLTGFAVTSSVKRTGEERQISGV